MTDAPLATQAPPGGDGLLDDGRSAAEALAAHLAAEAGSFLRELPSVDLHTLRRVGAALHTFDALLDPGWSQDLREELSRLGGLLGQERAYARRLARLLGSLDSLTCTDAAVAAADAGGPVRTAGPVPQPRQAEGLLARHPGAPKARALLDRQLTLGRSRAHTTALQELGSARFHALADRMTLLVTDLPLRPGAAPAPAAALLACAGAEAEALVTAVDALPLERAAVAYSGDMLHDPGDDQRWQQVRVLVLRTQYALEVCAPLAGGRAAAPAAALAELARTLARHRDAAEAAEAAALAALTPRITPATAYVLGVVHADQRLEVEAARHTFSSTWPDLDRSGWLTDAWLKNR
ncbi:CHAD domain-containing protein [Streptacidiphilus sp. N1-12]|uniref:CHAD domain-containing protein n=2 Tax=Streptacidiphilus alkalitolerans TaxID=3342712 RepID=A0ABV6V708_9ACTN